MLAPLRALDKLPPLAGIVVGVLAGAVAGLPLVLAAQPWGTLGFLAFVAIAVLLGVTARPIGVLVKDLDGFITMVELPGGTFQMGSPDSEDGHSENEGPVHEVTVSPFAIGKYQVTQAQYREIMGEDPGYLTGDNRPVNHMTWFNAAKFCNKLSERAGLKPCYKIGRQTVKWNSEADGYRLPTEAEWEYACRAGTDTAFSFGDDPTILGKYAWYKKNAKDINPVGAKLPNPWGLHDVHGNVWEWCWDWYSPYLSESMIDPGGPSSGLQRVVRGGAYWNVSGNLRSAHRGWNVPVFRSSRFGFRCVRSLAASIEPLIP